MTTNIHLYTRVTHQYVDAYRHLDREDFVGTVKALAPRVVRGPDEIDFSDAGSTRMRVIVPATCNASPHVIRQALHDTLSHSGCSHEYDCCGCRSTHASVHRVARREYSVTMSHSRNY